jgi:hypothetical protein
MDKVNAFDRTKKHKGPYFIILNQFNVIIIIIYFAKFVLSVNFVRNEDC